jgi:transposase-like protein
MRLRRIDAAKKEFPGEAARCGRFWITSMSMRRVGQRWSRLRARSAALRRRCINGLPGPSVIAAPAWLDAEMAAKLKALERENRELRQANEILRKASAYL